MVFQDRAHAGSLLARKLDKKKYRNAIVLALPRGGVPVAQQIAKYLSAPLDIIVVRKIGSPTQPEYGLGAISEGEILILDNDRMINAGISKDNLTEIISSEKKELQRRVEIYRQNKKLDVKGKDVILVDDGLATGVTARAAAVATRKLGTKRITYAAPVCARESTVELKKYVDEVVCLTKLDNMGAIGNYYNNFEQVSDEEVIKILSSCSLPD